MAKQSPAQQETIERVMHEFKHGELEKRDGEPVSDPKQAIAIALHEAGATNQETPRKNRETLRRTKAKERAGRTAPTVKETGPKQAERQKGETRQALYAEARRRGIPGRSRMRKDQLARALSR